MRISRLPAAWVCLLAAAPLLYLPAVAETNPIPAQTSAVGSLSPLGGSPQRDAAEAGLARLIERSHAPGSAFRANRIFNLADGQHLDQAKLGDGFQTYLVDPKRLLSGKRLSDCLYGSGEWRFVVLRYGKSVGLITVARLGSRWTMVEAGASELADEIASIAARYAQQMPGAHLRFVRSRQAVADFIQVLPPGPADAANAPVYVPLASARTLLAPDATGSNASGPALSDAQLDDTLRQGVQRGMRDPRIGH